MTIVIENDLRASEHSAQQLHDQLTLEHQVTTLAFDMEDLVKSLLELGRKLRSGGERIRSLQLSDADAIKLEDQWDAFNRSLENVSTRALEMIESFASDGYPITGAPELKKLRNELRIANTFSLARVRHSVKQANDGELTPLSAIRDALSN